MFVTNSNSPMTSGEIRRAVQNKKVKPNRDFRSTFNEVARTIKEKNDDKRMKVPDEDSVIIVDYSYFVCLEINSLLNCDVVLLYYRSFSYSHSHILFS